MATAMMQQYAAAKNAHPGMLLLFRSSCSEEWADAVRQRFAQ